MRRKLTADIKRNSQIGIKVKSITKQQLAYIASREDLTLSTLINMILVEYIGNYFKIAKVDWDKIPEDEK